MNMELGLYQEQTQGLVMTQQMQQAIKLLQCTSVELNEYLLLQANDNPLIEYTAPVGLTEALWSRRERRRNPIARTGDGWMGGSAFRNPLEQIVRVETTMTDILERQLDFMTATRRDIMNAKLLVGCLDESGYLECSDEVGEELCGGIAAYESALTLLHQCDPVGIGARSLRECLLLQVQRGQSTTAASRGDWSEEEMTKVILHHLEDVAAGHLQRIAKSLGLNVSLVQSIVDKIRNMNPRPGVNLGDVKAQYVIPEVFVTESGSACVVLMNEDVQPQLGIRPEYAAMLRNGDDDTSRYLQKHLQSAEWLIKGLHQRRATLHRVAQTIVQMQQRFFQEGPMGLRPLTLRQVADALELHESTVSRTVRGKYMQTPRGVFELKYFFGAELQSSVGTGNVSAKSVKYLIRQLIDSEDTSHPLSDEAVCKQMMRRGIHVSRRTVAKYRDELHIPSSSKRRRFG